MRTPFEYDVTAPRSRHNVHVTDREDLADVGEWSRDTLYEAVKFADDGDDGLVVVDYGRTALYVAAAADLTYEPPRSLGLRSPPKLHVADPARYDPDGPSAEPVDSVTVSPEFDLLVPAFDWEELDDDPLPPVEPRRSESPSGAGTGTPG